MQSDESNTRLVGNAPRVDHIAVSSGKKSKVAISLVLQTAERSGRGKIAQKLILGARGKGRNQKS